MGIFIVLINRKVLHMIADNIVDQVGEKLHKYLMLNEKNNF